MSNSTLLSSLDPERHILKQASMKLLKLRQTSFQQYRFHKPITKNCEGVTVTSNKANGAKYREKK